MAGKKKGKQRTGNKVDDLAIAERELTKGNTKIAVKHARIAYRRDPSGPIALLLSRALLNRTRDLYTRKMPEPARAILEELSSIAGDDFCEVDEVQRLKVLLGVGDVQTNGQQLSSDPFLLNQLIDAAVRSGDTKGCPSTLVPEVRLVRESLEAVAAGRDDEASELLQAIGRLSPLADWKLFVRGLIAFYSQAHDRRDSNWSRLTEGRLPFRIARSLAVASAPAGQARDPAIDRNRLRDVRKGLDTPLARNLRRLQTALQEGNRWTVSYGQLKQEFSQSHPEIVERVSEIIATKFIRESNYDEFERLQKMKPSLRHDPRMSRVTALFFEYDDYTDEAIKSWKAYINDLAKSEKLNPSQRESAIALVYLHLARLSGIEASELEAQVYPEWPKYLRDSIADDVKDHQQAADNYFAKSRQHDAGLKGAYADHCRMLDKWGEVKRASGLYEEFASRFEDDFEVQLEAASHFRFTAREPAKAQRYARSAEKLRPRDPQVAKINWECAFDIARLAAREDQFEVALAELDQAEKYVGPGRETFVLEAMRAAVDLKSGNLEGAETRYQGLMQSQPDFAPAAALVYCANALQCGVSNRIRSELNTELTAATKSHVNSLAGGAMARYFNSLTSADITYHGFKAHEKLVSTYLKKCPKKGWSEGDLVDAVLYAFEREEMALLKHLSGIGCKRFASNPYFWLGLGASEMSRGPRSCNRRKAIHYYETAIALSQDAQTHALPNSLLEYASRSISLLKMPPPPRRFRGSSLPPGIDLPPEFKELMDDLDMSPAEVIESVLRGENAGKFFDRRRKERC